MKKILKNKWLYIMMGLIIAVIIIVLLLNNKKDEGIDLYSDKYSVQNCVDGVNLYVPSGLYVSAVNLNLYELLADSMYSNQNIEKFHFELQDCSYYFLSNFKSYLYYFGLEPNIDLDISTVLSDKKNVAAFVESYSNAYVNNIDNIGNIYYSDEGDSVFYVCIEADFTFYDCSSYQNIVLDSPEEDSFSLKLHGTISFYEVNDRIYVYLLGNNNDSNFTMDEMLAFSSNIEFTSKDSGLVNRLVAADKSQYPISCIINNTSNYGNDFYKVTYEFNKNIGLTYTEYDGSKGYNYSTIGDLTTGMFDINFFVSDTSDVKDLFVNLRKTTPEYIYEGYYPTAYTSVTSTMTLNDKEYTKHIIKDTSGTVRVLFYCLAFDDNYIVLCATPHYDRFNNTNWILSAKVLERSILYNLDVKNSTISESVPEIDQVFSLLDSNEIMLYDYEDDTYVSLNNYK